MTAGRLIVTAFVCSALSVALTVAQLVAWLCGAPVVFGGVSALIVTLLFVMTACLWWASEVYARDSET